jgi:hypothetical protein
MTIGGSIVGGSIASIAISGREFSVAADADVKLFVGGRVGHLERNGDQKTSRFVYTNENWSLTGAQIAIDHERGDLQFLASLRDDTELYLHHDNVIEDDGVMRRLTTFMLRGALATRVEIELVDGTVYWGVGIPVGKVEVSTWTSLAAVDFEGTGKLEMLAA